MRVRRSVVVLGLAVCLQAALAEAQTSVQLPSAPSTTTLTAAVSEQAFITVPSAASFNVTDIRSTTTTSDQTVIIAGIVLASATKQLQVSLRANAGSFTPPVAGATTWGAGDVSWTSPAGGPKAWVNATRANGTLSNAAFTTVATCNANATTCSTTGLRFALAPKTTVTRSGGHTLVVTWKFESIGS